MDGMGGERVRGARWIDSGGYMSEIETSDYGRQGGERVRGALSSGQGLLVEKSKSPVNVNFIFNVQ